MKDIYDLVKEHEAKLEEFIEWQIDQDHGLTNDFHSFAEANVQVEDLFKHAAILYPKFVLIESQVVLSDHYSKDNWDNWRKSRDARSTANIVNHVHVEDYLSKDYKGTVKLSDGLGDLLVFFWSMAVKQQYPNHNINVEYDGDVINIINA